MVIVPTHKLWLLICSIVNCSIECAGGEGQGEATMDEGTRQPLTDKMERVLSYIRHEIITTGVPPSRPQAAKALDLNVSTITWYLKELEKRGWLTLRKGTRRGISLSQSRRLPVVEPLERLAPDMPLLAESHIIEYMPELLARSYAPAAEFFMRVGSSGSMEAPGYRPGDLIGVRAWKEPNEDPNEGRAVVVRVDEEVRFRVFRRRTKRSLELVMLNDEGKAGRHETVDLGKHEARIEGIVVHTLMALSLAEFNYLEERYE